MNDASNENSSRSDKSNPKHNGFGETGRVTLVGAGPGDIGLITVAGLAALQAADVVVFDALSNPRLLENLHPETVCIDVGKRARQHKMKQDEINALLVEKAKAGYNVVRLKGGDPFLFGRGAEEVDYIASHGVHVRVIPGVTSGIAAPATAGIPVTHRHTAVSVTFVTGHEDPEKSETGVDYEGLARLIQCGGTVCFYMGVGRLGLICQTLIDLGLQKQTPVALVQWGTLPNQRSARGTLGDIVSKVESQGLSSPAIIVVGDAAGLDLRGMDFFTRRPLFGQRIVITRTRRQASTLRQRLDELGADTLEMPTIEIVPPKDWRETDNRLQQAAEGQWDWIVLTSVNAVEAMAQRMHEHKMDARDFWKVRFAVIGDSTEHALKTKLGIRADFVPEHFVAESFVRELAATERLKGQRLLLLRADIARPALPEGLKDHGAEVLDCEAYQTGPAGHINPQIRKAVEQGEVDWITFTSSSTVRNFFELLKGIEATAGALKFASIGPVTSATLREVGYEPTVEATRHDVEGLIEIMVQFANKRQ